MYSEYFEQLDDLQRQILDEELLLEMTNILESDCITDNINFSFYFSNSQGQHTISAKIRWNRDKFNPGADGTIQLFGNYKYIESKNCTTKGKIRDIEEARNFFKKYKVLFAAVRCDKLDSSSVRKYFEGKHSFKDLLNNFYGISYFEDIVNCNNLNELEQIVRRYKLFNLYDGS